MWSQEAEVGGIHLQTKECQGSLATARSCQKLGEKQGMESPSEPPEGIHPANNLTSHF